MWKVRGAAPTSVRRAAPGWAGLAIYALGHSTRPLEQLLEMLLGFGIPILADIRSIPRSRHNPQFNRDSLPRALAPAGILYVHLARLGGRRHGLGAASPNGAWRNASFRGYADYMATPEFEQGLEDLRQLARQAPVALMCSEAVPWRCHRSLVADALWARGVVVQQILAPSRAEPHRLTPFARIDGRRVTYPAETTAEASP